MLPVAPMATVAPAPARATGAGDVLVCAPGPASHLTYDQPVQVLVSAATDHPVANAVADHSPLSSHEFEPAHETRFESIGLCAC